MLKRAIKRNNDALGPGMVCANFVKRRLDVLTMSAFFPFTTIFAYWCKSASAVFCTNLSKHSPPNLFKTLLSESGCMGARRSSGNFTYDVTPGSPDFSTLFNMMPFISVS